MTALTPYDIANRIASETYALLEDEHSKTSLAIEALLTDVCADAMLSAGVPEGDPRTGGFDLRACNLFTPSPNVYGQIHQEIVEHIFRATRLYFEGIGTEPVPISRS